MYCLKCRRVTETENITTAATSENCRLMRRGQYITCSKTRTQFSKLFKPVTDMQKDLKQGLVSELKQIRKDTKNLPRATTFPQFPSITAYDDDGEEEEDAVI